MAPASMAALSASHALAAPARLLPASAPSTSRRAQQPRSVVVVASADGAISRRQVAVTSLTALSVLLFSSSSSQSAQARDIPLFGLKKAKKISEQVVQEVNELVKEGEEAISSAVAEFPGVAGPNIPSFSGEGPSAAVQAGAVAAAGVVGVLVASTVVNALVSPAE